MPKTILSICIDARMVLHSGIGVYIRNYIIYLISESRFSITLIGNKDLISKVISIPVDVKIIETNCPIYSIKEQLYLPFLIPKCDIFWSPHYNLPIFPIRARKILLTIPDIAHINMSKFLGFGFAKKIYSRVVMIAGLLKSDMVTTISDFSKKEICQFQNVSKKMRVIHLGIDTNKFYKKSDLGYIFDIQTKYSLPEKYILFVGNVKPHKNLTNLVLAFEILIREQNDIYLLIAGKKDGFITGDENLFRFINNNEILKSKIKFTGYIEENDLSYIYSLAQVFAFPSLYEGFGFPPLEAMASGCPVVASNAASIPEVCGNNVLYFNPLKPEEIYESLKIILVDELLRRSYIEKGLEHVKKFNWKKSGKEFVSVIESL